MWFLVLCLALYTQGTGALPLRQSTIKGGSDCMKYNHDWMVLVADQESFKCVGVLVDPQWVLTSADCQNFLGDEVSLGLHTLEDFETEAQAARISHVFTHPLFKPSKSFTELKDVSHNLMLLLLEEPVTMSVAEQVLALPSQEPDLGSNCSIFGLGLMHPSEVLPLGQCTAQWKETEFTLCAGHLNISRDICVGDSGAPLLCDGMLQGIMAPTGDYCTYRNTQSIYAKVSPHLGWIRATIDALP
ncbi:arginine esterase-like isoform X2 [Dasypus novemcinctus]|uniref:arginine esterase-like isoform X2 n=1 Tax=Dasypus novemcinctus TaxID=9361 RepID=UPI00265DDB4F|nr:arginine esterase-like isoform X2 [Dasypus novemcinctus]